MQPAFWRTPLPAAALAGHELGLLFLDIGEGAKRRFEVGDALVGSVPFHGRFGSQPLQVAVVLLLLRPEEKEVERPGLGVGIDGELGIAEAVVGGQERARFPEIVPVPYR